MTMRMPDLVLGSISLKCTGNSHKRLEADDRIVAANAVVDKSFEEPNIVVGGIPAKKISYKGFKDRKIV